VDYDPVFPLLIANGVIGIRDMGGVLNVGQFYVWRDEIRRGTLIGPRFEIAGALVDGPGAVNPFSSIVVGNSTSARTAVESLKQQGADFIKVYSLLSRSAYLAIADEARKLRMPFAGHVPDSVTAMEASNLGQKSIEHLTGIALACATDEPERRTQLKARLAGQLTPGAEWRTRVTTEAQALDAYDPQKAAALFRRFVINDTWQCPTLTSLQEVITDENNPPDEKRLQYLWPSLKRLWSSDGSAAKLAKSLQTRAREAAEFSKDLALVKAMRDAGVELLAGTDSPNCLPGFCLHDELLLLVQAGLTPMEALQTATRNAARYFDREQDWGTVEVGKLADLVLLDADPLNDIRNTQKIRAVVIAGRLLNRSELDAMLDKVKRHAQ
jgi:hypothetical protein